MNVTDIVDDLNEQIAILEYLAEVEDKPGLSNILSHVSTELEGIKLDIAIEYEEGTQNEKT